MLEDWVKPTVTEALNDATEIGEVVSVISTLEPPVGDMWLPSKELSPEEQFDLTFMEVEGQIAELENRGAFMFGRRELKITLIGNRSDELHIVDLRPVSNCSNVKPGALLIMQPVAGGPVETTTMLVDVEHPEEEPRKWDPEAARRGDEGDKPSFFDDEVISLKKDEKVFFNIFLQSERSACTVNLEVTMQEEEQIHKQLLLDRGEEIFVGPSGWPHPDISIEKVYVGGAACHTWWEVPLEMVTPIRDLNVCTYAANAAYAHPSAPRLPTPAASSLAVSP